MDSKYVVVAPYITAHTGGRIVGFTAGSPLPPDVPDWNVQHLLKNDLIADADKREELVAARPGEPTGAHGRSGLKVDQLVEDEETGSFGNPFVVSGITTADPVYAARAKQDPEKAAEPRPDPSTILDPKERLEAEKARVEDVERVREAEVKARETREERAQAKAEGRPSQAEPKDAWVEYAVKKGVSREEAEASSKEQLVGRFGPRQNRA